MKNEPYIYRRGLGRLPLVSRNRQKLLKRLNGLIKEIQRTPFDGTGKPEPLKANLSGYWSRRISIEHRLIYKVSDDGIVIVACRFHYRT